MHHSRPQCECRFKGASVLMRKMTLYRSLLARSLLLCKTRAALLAAGPPGTNPGLPLCLRVAPTGKQSPNHQRLSDRDWAVQLTVLLPAPCTLNLRTQPGTAGSELVSVSAGAPVPASMRGTSKLLQRSSSHHHLILLQLFPH